MFIKTNFEKSLNVFIWLLGVFFLHRALSFSQLNRDDQISANTILDSLFVGALSDIWIAALGAFVGFLLLSLLRLILRGPENRWPDRLLLLWPLFLLMLTVLHQSYVEFFKIQVLADHLKYFGDLNFIEGNADTAAEPSALIILFAALAGGLVMKLRWSGSALQLGRGCALLLVVALGLHSLNIRWRIQHFIQEHLQVNFIEKLYLNLKVPTNPQPLSEAQWLVLENYLQRPTIDQKQRQQALLRWSPLTQDVEPFLERLKSATTAAMDAQEQPLFLTVVLESARPAEFGPYGKMKQPDLTPSFTKLAETGVLFQNMYTVGSVTRSGQEAVWCGYLSSLYVSLMRERPDIRVDCLPKLDGQSGHYFWWHGGQGAFDNQAIFWRNQAVDQLITQKDFSAETARSGWGVSDLALVKRSLTELRSLNTDKKYLMGMLLSMTNHIPWPLPEDATVHAELAALGGDHHPSYDTTRYTDDAIATLVEGLRQQKLWKKTILMIVSDHGMADQPYRELYQNPETKTAQLKSHGVLLLSGGLVEATLKGGGDQRISRFVSQASVGAFWAYLLGVDEPMFAPPLFSKAPRLPIFASLEGEVYFPEHDIKIKNQKMMTAKLNSFSPSVQPGILYFRAYLNFLNKIVQKK